jgi:hypothetical protein
MPRVKILKKVPLLGEDGVVFDARPGEEHDVSPEVAEALLRGQDADILSETTGPAATEPEEQAATPKKKRRSAKNRGAAPENK